MKAKSEIMLMLIPKNGMAQMPAAMEMGIPSDTYHASLGCRKRPNTMTTRTNPCKPLENIKLIRPSNKTDWSFHTSSCTPGGKFSGARRM